MGKYKNYLTIFILFLVCTLTIGYAAFGSEVSISNIVADIRVEKDIRITDVKIVSTNNVEINELDYDADSILSNIDLPEANSTVTLEVSVTNFGNTEMGIYGITGLSNNLSSHISGYKLQDKLCDETGKCSLGSTTQFNITVGYNTFDSSVINYDIRLDLEFRKMHSVTYDGISNNGYPTSVIDGGTLTFTASGTIPPKIVVFNSTENRIDYDLYSYNNNVFNYSGVYCDVILRYKSESILIVSTEGNHFKEADYVSSIKNVEFVDYIDESSVNSALKSYDLSKAGDKSIIGWIDSNYKLWIGSDWTIYVEHFGQFFYGMNMVESIIFSNINTSRAESMYSMFAGCSSLKTIDLSMFSTNRMYAVHTLFDGCTNLKSINFGNFDVSKVSKLNALFRGCSSLETIDLSSFDVSNVNEFIEMFYGASSLKSLNLSHFVTSSATSFYRMFRDCASLESLDISNFTSDNVESFGSMFHGCSSLTSLDVTKFNTSKATNMEYMFYNMKSLTLLDVSNFDTSSAKYFQYMFCGLENVASLNLASFVTDNALNMKHMFENMYKVTELDLGHFKTANVTEMASMFENAKALVSLDISGFDTSNVTRMDSMFQGAAALTELDLTHFDTRKVTNMTYIFNSATNLKKVLVSDLWVIGENTTAINMYLFSGIESTGVTYV